MGLVSYLLIGFWYQKPTAIHANMKAFLVNRVGDFGFLLGISLILFWFGSLDYIDVFNRLDALSEQTIQMMGNSFSLMTLIAILLFIGAMGKSAQVPLHVWLPDSMEGPTPISALIHAATMVTAGIFLVARVSPIVEFSETALSFILIIGSITALFMGLLGIFQSENTYLWQSTPLVASYRQPLNQFNSLKWRAITEPLRYRIAQKQYVEDLENLAFTVTQSFFDLLLAKINSPFMIENF